MSIPLTSKKIFAFIPELGSKLNLTGDWTFKVYNEHRNHDLLRADGKMKMVPTYIYQVGLDPKTGQPFPPVQSGTREESILGRSSNQFYKRTLPKGTELIVDRIYVRKDMSDFSSVSLVIAHTTDPNLVSLGPRARPFTKKGSPKVYARFWVKLEDFNSAFLEVVV